MGIYIQRNGTAEKIPGGGGLGPVQAGRRLKSGNEKPAQ